MTRTLLAAALTGLLMSTTAFAAMGDKVRDIEVSMDLTAVSNAAAAARFANVATDLQGAIARRMAGQIDESGKRISVDISEIELSNSYSETAGMADTRLVGRIVIKDSAGSTNLETYELTIDVDQSAFYIPQTMDRAQLMASSDLYYASMINAFADNVVKNFNK
ncbi:MAG: hypothetical protein ACK4GO_10480 [Gemmobacter sp.]